MSVATDSAPKMSSIEYIYLCHLRHHHRCWPVFHLKDEQETLVDSETNTDFNELELGLELKPKTKTEASSIPQDAKQSGPCFSEVYWIPVTGDNHVTYTT